MASAMMGSQRFRPVALEALQSSLLIAQSRAVMPIAVKFAAGPARSLCRSVTLLKYSEKENTYAGSDLVLQPPARQSLRLLCPFAL